MWVDPADRGSGLAAALVGAVVGWARGRGAERVILNVVDANVRASRLYERCGFRPTGVRGRMREAPNRQYELVLV
jgi:ribosomal protein S18 acetylase RimI-like enzyme